MHQMGESIPTSLVWEVRSYYKKNFTMRELQEEQTQLMSTVKPSLSLKLKYQLTLRIIMKSDFFYYYRLFLLSKYEENKKDYEINFKRGTLDPNKAYLSPKKLTQNFKSLINRLIRHMEITNHSPG